MKLPAILLFLACLRLAPAFSEPLTLEIDFAKTNGLFRPLHGVNKGPLGAGGLIDLSEPTQALSIPFTRLHDCHWPNPDVVDIHAVFPNFEADPDEPSSYQFALTDDYLAAIRATGSKIIYRLGESIEHTKTRRFVHPPTDLAKWAAVCLGIIRHYNEGWANGFHWNIEYWEIWNEPENRPSMWSGSDGDYFRLYQTAAKAIKSRFPNLKVGGPALGFSGQFVKGEFRPSDFALAFLDLCRREPLPLDFFSWHCYTADPAELTRRAKAIRVLLDARGFAKTESHLNEWNYLPGNSWSPLSKSSRPEARQQYYEQMGGLPGAAFLACSLLELQDAPVDVCNLFHGELGGFGLFNEQGVPLKNYYALLAFRKLLASGQRVETVGSLPGRLALAASINPEKSSAALLISNYQLPGSEFHLLLKNLPWKSNTQLQFSLLDESHNLAVTRSEALPGGDSPFSISIKSPGVGFLELRGH